MLLTMVSMLVFMAVVSIWTPLSIPRIYERWFSLPNFFFLLPIPIVSSSKLKT